LKSSAAELKLPARAEKFRDLGGFPATLLNFLLTIRISNERAEIRPTTLSKPQKIAIFSRTFDWRPAEEKIPSPFDISSDSFVLAAATSRISVNNF
jgi:hypothetical protein